MKYMGSKSRIVDNILPIIQERIDVCSDLARTKGLELYQMYLKQNTRRKNN